MSAILSSVVLCGLAELAQAVLMPNKKRVKVSGIYIDEDEVGYASVGENVRIKLLGCEEDALGSGTILCGPDSLCPVATKILAYVKVMELLEHRPLLTAGYTCVMHVHTAREEVMLGKILGKRQGPCASESLAAYCSCVGASCVCRTPVYGHFRII